MEEREEEKNLQDVRHGSIRSANSLVFNGGSREYECLTMVYAGKKEHVAFYHSSFQHHASLNGLAVCSARFSQWVGCKNLDKTAHLSRTWSYAKVMRVLPLMLSAEHL